jgi:2-oxoglutarate dehydrogenase E2 component (dihydrolipoamide succinyltransferase)
MRRRIAERLVEAQHQAALLTTFNEVDMTSVMGLRKKFKDNFVDRHGVKLGFMSFFVRAAVEALNVVPQVNAEFRDPHIVYRDFCDIGIAVGGGKGLVVPILRNAEQMNFAQIEQSIGDFARRAADNKVKLEELQGGTFTISNGGVYGTNYQPAAEWHSRFARNSRAASCCGWTGCGSANDVRSVVLRPSNS